MATTNSKNENFPHWKLLMATIIISLTGYCLGTTVAFPSPAIAKMDTESTFHLTIEQKSWVVSTVYLGGLIGGLLQRPLAGGLGRNLALMISLLPLSIGWAIIITARNPWMLYVGRFLTGIYTGLVHGCSSIYLAEITLPKHRGFLLSLYPFFLAFGIFWTYVIGEYFSWRWLVVSILSFNVIILIGLMLIPESPRWLMLTKHKEAASDSLKWFRGHDNVLNELNEIEENILATNTVETLHFREMLKRENYYPAFATLCLTGIMSSSGISVFDAYTVYVFQTAHIRLNPFLATTIMGLMEFLSNFITLSVVDRVKRRHLLIASGLGMTISHVSLAAYYIIKSSNSAFVDSWLSWLPVASSAIFFVTFAFGWNSLPFIMIGELLPIRIRGFMSGANSVMFYLLMYLTTQLFPIIQNASNFTPFILYAAVSILGVLFAIFVIPETMGKTLEEIEKSFRRKDDQ